MYADVELRRHSTETHAMQLRATAHHSNRVSQASVQVGDATILRIEERLGPAVPPEILLPGLDSALLREHASWLEPQHRDPATGLLVISIHSWLLRTGAHTILIDACAGNDKQRLRPESAEFHEQRAPWLERLAAQGVRPEDVDFVMCTHLHVDHVGWNTRLVDGRWVPTFPNAKYLFSRREYEFWDPRRRMLPPHANDGVFEDSVLPVVEAGLAELVDGAHEPVEGLRIEPAPGHTPGHFILHLTSAHREALFSGDLMHHALQVWAPELNSAFCEDPVQATATRRRVLDACCERDVLVLPAHFGAPHAGRVRARRGGGFAFEFMAR